MNRRDIKREAKFRAGFILESAVSAGWSGDTRNVERFGQEAADMIGEEIAAIAARLIEQGS
jgi:hypothetical protein